MPDIGTHKRALRDVIQSSQSPRQLLYRGAEHLEPKLYTVLNHAVGAVLEVTMAAWVAFINSVGTVNKKFIRREFYIHVHVRLQLHVHVHVHCTIVISLLIR